MVTNVNRLVRLYAKLSDFDKRRVMSFLVSLASAQQSRDDGENRQTEAKTYESGLSRGILGRRCPVCYTRLQGPFCHNCGWTSGAAAR